MLSDELNYSSFFNTFNTIRNTRKTGPVPSPKCAEVGAVELRGGGGGLMGMHWNGIGLLFVFFYH